MKKNLTFFISLFLSFSTFAGVDNHYVISIPLNQESISNESDFGPGTYVYSERPTTFESEIEKIINGDSTGNGDSQKNIAKTIEQLETRLNSSFSYSSETIEKMLSHLDSSNENIKSSIKSEIAQLKAEISNDNPAFDYVSAHNTEISLLSSSLPYLDILKNEPKFQSSSERLKETAFFSSFVSKVVEPENTFLVDAANHALQNADRLALSGNIEASQREIKRANKLLDNALSPLLVPEKEWSSTGETKEKLVTLHKQLSKVRTSSEKETIGKELGLAALIEADEASSNGDEELAKRNIEIAKEGLDIALGLIPVTSLGQSLYEAFTGKSIVTGEDIGTFGQAMAILGVVTLGGSNAVKSSLKVVGKIGEAALKGARETSRKSFRETFSFTAKFSEFIKDAKGEIDTNGFFDIMESASKKGFGSNEKYGEFSPFKPSFMDEHHIEKNLSVRGWTKSQIGETVNKPSQIFPTRDVRYRKGQERLDEPATGYVNQDGSYVVKNDNTGDIVQISNKNDQNWLYPLWHPMNKR